ncbi:uncharacterized protein BDZ99DRAFT_236096 [Mytilinidion resinicola]|uniref:Uncharacterized protein n=1 Tax=Mytilinidion resinicola TaxID=574789 RepID=A0A6A6Z101_9PEZI|nr:uncharacterized protein BDZ99DRAFT_236096 [Mytilinidion resinicola]KAF2814389.1 hypothetical protein BDZ99DRAFT_236096 [Mytilinidion resinicola]
MTRAHCSGFQLKCSSCPCQAHLLLCFSEQRLRSRHAAPVQLHPKRCHQGFAGVGVQGQLAELLQSVSYIGLIPYYTKTVKIWDASRSACLQTLDGHSRIIISMARPAPATALLTQAVTEALSCFHRMSRIIIRSPQHSHSSGWSMSSSVP